MRLALLFLTLCGLAIGASYPPQAPAFFATQAAGIAYRYLGRTNLTTAASSYLTQESFTPTANALCLAIVINSKASAPDTPTFSGNNITWVRIDTTNYNTVASPTARITMFRGMTNTPSAGQATADFGGASQTGCLIYVVEYTGVDTSGSGGSGAVVQYKLGSGDASTAPSLTMSALGGSGTHAVHVGWGGDLNSTTVMTAETDWTEAWDQGYNTPATWAGVMYRLNTTDNTPSATTTSIDWAGIAVEIKKAP